eukprot:Opistho-2@71397
MDYPTMNGKGHISARGFTLIELLVVMSIIAVLITLALPRFFKSFDTSKDKALLQDLSIMRDAIDKYYGDHAKYPDTLNELVDEHYIRSIPVDPVTDSNSTWVLIQPKAGLKGKIFDIKSGAEGSSFEGKTYDQY